MPPYLQSRVFGMQIWHLLSLPQIHPSHVCDIFARTKIVQIHFRPRKVWKFTERRVRISLVGRLIKYFKVVLAASLVGHLLIIRTLSLHHGHYLFSHPMASASK